MPLSSPKPETWHFAVPLQALQAAVPHLPLPPLWASVVCSPTHVLGLRWHTAPPTPNAGPPAPLAVQTQQALEAYLLQANPQPLRALPWALPPKLSPFATAVLQAVAAVPWGHTVGYGALAQAAGHPAGAARAVGQAMASNPLPLLLPCHRVVGAGAAQPKAYMGLATLAPFKTALLAWEALHGITA